ncbi:radical SAM domain protein [Pseudooceanicola batsensis HTCC2597]|uniref:Radical SAM domain protein n=1 Tax=Pseudooceanicola batsensis (strain ATCC BAA-863 / DSM 15984 / KCTC 12145 / HTCC2597) TaxID=252305 RepID=A3TXN9_PSEBH|nr:PA0069 family radical SAM protein [Pseudooceanicola batsensis]EAQ03599.1 radical SAM domain protein [Pseudooceanicola batsensis HTCC2597]
MAELRPLTDGHAIDADARRGRGASTNQPGRYETADRVAVDDGWDLPDEVAQIRTEVRPETARSLITYNRSPDLPFDRSINVYRGCEHGCVYCFARPTHAYLGLSPGLDFETRLTARVNAAEVLERELRSRRYAPATIAIGTNTDPYQPAEHKLELTRACLEVLRDYRHPVAIVTKGTGILRDLDILSDMAAQGLASVGVSVTTLSPDIARRMEPRVPPPAKRLAVIRALAEAGVPVRLMASPIVPGLTDTEVEAILEAGRDAGARGASWIMLRLPQEVAPLVETWLREAWPDRADKILNRLREMHGGKLYEAQWGRRMRGEGVYARMIAARFEAARRRVGLDERMPPLRTDLFRHPPRVGDQLGLFD